MAGPDESLNYKTKSDQILHQGKNGSIVAPGDSGTGAPGAAAPAIPVKGGLIMGCPIIGCPIMGCIMGAPGPTVGGW